VSLKTSSNDDTAHQFEFPFSLFYCRPLLALECAEPEAGDRSSGGFVTQNSEKWPWPDSLDAVIAAPNHHKLLFENERVRVLEVRIASGDLVPVHTHRWPASIYVAKQSDFLRRDQDGNLLFDSRTLGPPPAKPFAQWTPPLPPHSVENIGGNEILLISTELKESAND